LRRPGIFAVEHPVLPKGGPDQNSPHIISTAGDKVWTSGQWNVTFQAQDGAPVQMKGYWLDVDVRQGNMENFGSQPRTRSPTAVRACSDDVEEIGDDRNKKSDLPSSATGRKTQCDDFRFLISRRP